MLAITAFVLAAELVQVQSFPPPAPSGPAVIWVLRRYQPWGTGVEAKFATYEQCMRAKWFADRRNHPLTSLECQQELGY